MSTTTDDRRAIIVRAREAIERDRLRVDHIDAKPQNYDFSENRWKDDEPTWEFLDAAQCDDCDRYIVEGEDHGYVDQDGDATEIPVDLDVDSDDFELWAESEGIKPCPRTGDDFREFDSAEGPMMNFRYPIGANFDADSARTIADLPLCLVQFDGDEVYLALTGGGMDMSWEICEGYIRLGYLPPTHFRLPRMADKYLNDHTALVVLAVEEANRIQANWATRCKDSATELLADLRIRGEDQ